MQIPHYQPSLTQPPAALNPGALPAGAQPFSLSSQLPSIPSAFESLNAQAPPDALGSPVASLSGPAEDSDPNELKDAFHDFVGQTFFGEMIKAFRTTQQPSKYFHGGRAEEIFQGQFDQVLTEKLSDASSAKIADPMFELFMLKRNS